MSRGPVGFVRRCCSGTPGHAVTCVAPDIKGEAMMDFGALVRSGSVPNVEGFFRADGTVRRVYYADRSCRGSSWVPLSSHNGNTIPMISWTSTGPPGTVLASEVGSVCCGEGPMGADGFFARLDPDRVPVWVVFMTNSNPFLQVHVQGMKATFTNNLDHSVVIDLRLSEFAA